MKLAALVVLAACASTPAPNHYLETGETGVKTGGVKVIPIHTPKGDFHVWTKRFGNGRIKGQGDGFRSAAFAAIERFRQLAAICDHGSTPYLRRREWHGAMRRFLGYIDNRRLPHQQIR